MQGKRRSLYVLHNVGSIRWDGVMEGKGMACMLMAMKGMMLLPIERNSLNDGRSMKSECTHMTTMEIVMGNSMDFLSHLLNVSA